MKEIELRGNVCVFGDSIVWGAWDSEKAGWVNRLAIYCQNENDENIVYNLGIPSETTTELLKRIDNECIVRNPDAIIISIGINDTIYLKDMEKEKTNINVFKDNIEKIINIAKNCTKNIIFMGLTKVNEENTTPINWNDNEMYINENIEAYNEIIQNICRENEIQFIKLLDVLDLDDLSEDGIHPNSKGHEKIFQKVKENNIK